MMSDFIISSFGMISSIGRDAITTCSSFRAGITRADEINDFKIIDEDDHEIVPILAHPIKGITDGFSCLGRWLQMGLFAFFDMVHIGRLPSRENTTFWQDTGVIFVTPVLDDRRFLFVPEVHKENIQERYLNLFLNEINYPIDTQNQKIISMGHSGTIHAIIEAERWLSSDSLKRVIIISADSLLDSMSLLWLGEAERLRPKPTGLMPGEASVCLLIESRDSLKQWGGQVFAHLKKKAVSKEKNFFFSGEKSTGIGLSYAIDALLKDHKITFRGDLYIDLNGEAWRAAEFGTAMVRASSQLENYNEKLPAVTVGDIGAASGAFSIALAIASFQRKYAASDESIILSSSEYGEIGALLVSEV